MLRNFLVSSGLILCALISSIVLADGHVAVIYPDTPSPFNQIFEEIVNGAKQKHSGEVITFSLAKKESPARALNWLNDNQAESVIALGLPGYKLAKSMLGNKKVVVSALPIIPNGLSGISLIPAPEQLFDSLKQLAPTVEVINVVYSPRSEWIIKLAEVEAQSRGYTIKSTRITSVKEALKAYDEILADFNSKKESLWIPFDPISGNEQVIIPNLLERSWEQNFILFSSKPAHVKRGALFTLFPNHVELGKALIDMLNEMETTNQPRIEPIRFTKLAVNLRTAAHLGFEYKNQQKSQFHLTFPE